MLTVILQSYGVSFDLPKNFIHTSLAQSLFKDVLDNDPDASEVTIQNPDVTPDAMEVIANYAHGLEPVHSNSNLILADRYLNIPWLLYYADPNYDRIPDHDNITNPINQPLWDEFIETNESRMVAYFLQKGWKPILEDLMLAIKTRATGVIQVLLMEGQIDPGSQDNFALRRAAYNGDVETVRLLLADPRVNPASRDNVALQEAAYKRHIEVVKLLLADPRVDPNVDSSEPIMDAILGKSWDLLKLFLDDPRVDPNVILGLLINPSYYPEAVRILLEHPRISPKNFLNPKLRSIAGLGPYRRVPPKPRA